MTHQTTLPYFNARSNLTEERDTGTSTTDLTGNQANKKPLKPIVQAYLKALIKITRQIERSSHHKSLLTEALKLERPPRGLTPTIKHNIARAPTDLIINWNKALHETGITLTTILVEYWTGQLETLHIEFEKVKAQLEERENITEEQWNEIREILENVSQAVREELIKRRTQFRRDPNRQASKVRLIQPEQEKPLPQRVNKRQRDQDISAGKAQSSTSVTNPLPSTSRDY